MEKPKRDNNTMAEMVLKMALKVNFKWTESRFDGA